MRNDILPKSGKFIMNLDDRNGDGTHWVAVDIDNKLYFDSFGAPPPNEVCHLINGWNDEQLQAITDDKCGEYCLYFLKHSSNNKNKNLELLSSMKANKLWPDNI
jgi:hypothetical protein